MLRDVLVSNELNILVSQSSTWSRAPRHIAVEVCQSSSPSACRYAQVRVTSILRENGSEVGDQTRGPSASKTVKHQALLRRGDGGWYGGDVVGRSRYLRASATVESLRRVTSRARHFLSRLHHKRGHNQSKSTPTISPHLPPIPHSAPARLPPPIPYGEPSRASHRAYSSLW